MGYGWKILKAAVEQVILFPSKLAFQAYFADLAQKCAGKYEIVSKAENDDGTVTVVVRKPYNQNEFLYSADQFLP